MSKFSNKVAVVTGASRGIGQAIGNQNVPAAHDEMAERIPFIEDRKPARVRSRVQRRDQKEKKYCQIRHDIEHISDYPGQQRKYETEPQRQ